MSARAATVDRGGINWELVLIGIGAVAALYLLHKASGVAAAATNAVSSAIASGIEALTIGPPIQAAGSVDDAAGNALGPISSFNASHDSQGNTYLAIGGEWYMMGPRDASGNFTAIPTGQAVSS